MWSPDTHLNPGKASALTFHLWKPSQPHLHGCCFPGCRDTSQSLLTLHPAEKRNGPCQGACREINKPFRKQLPSVLEKFKPSIINGHLQLLRANASLSVLYMSFLKDKGLWARHRKRKRRWTSLVQNGECEIPGVQPPSET